MRLGGVIKVNLGGPGQVRNIPKAVLPLWTKVQFQAVSANNAQTATTKGLLELKNIDGINGYLPLNVFDLTFNQQMVHNWGNDLFAMQYTNGGAWDNLYSQTLDAGLLGPTAVANSNGLGGSGDWSRCTEWIHKSVNLRLLLYGRDKASTTYKIIFFRCPHAETTPGPAVFEGRKPELFQNFWHRYLAKYTVNPVNVIPNILAFTGQADKKPQILKQFTFFIKEKLSTEDATQKVNVNFKIDINKLKVHLADEGFQPVSDINNVAEVAIADQSTNRNAQKSVHAQQRLYMAIMATNYEVEGQTNYETPSYDFGYQSMRYASELVRV